jgi:hypothetical protein
MTTPIKALFAAIATAAIAVSVSAPVLADDGWGRGDRNGYGDSFRHGYREGNPRHAVAACSRIAEIQASRSSYGRARVTDIRDVRNTRWGYEVRGRLVVQGRDYDRHDRGWNDRDYGRGWGDSYRRHDSGSFTCRVERGRVAYLDIDGIRGL